MGAVIPSRTAEFEQSEGSHVAIGPIEIEMSRGRCLFVDAPGCTIGQIGRSEDQSIGIFVYDPDANLEPGCPGMGMVVQLSAASARKIAASLLRCADAISAEARH